jgi:hypothetical protein
MFGGMVTALATADDLAARLNTTFTDGELAQVERLLADASATVRTYTGQTFTLTTYTDVKLRVNGNIVRMPQRPVVSVQAVTDSTAVAVSYTWLGFDSLRVSSWIDRFDYEPFFNEIPYVLVDYTAGYTAIPDLVIGITCQIAGRAFGSPASDAGITQESLGAYSYSRGAVAGAGAFGLMEQEKILLDRYRLMVGSAYVLR